MIIGIFARDAIFVVFCSYFCAYSDKVQLPEDRVKRETDCRTFSNDKLIFHISSVSRSPRIEHFIRFARIQLLLNRSFLLSTLPELVVSKSFIHSLLIQTLVWRSTDLTIL